MTKTSYEQTTEEQLEAAPVRHDDPKLTENRPIGERGFGVLSTSTGSEVVFCDRSAEHLLVSFSDTWAGGSRGLGWAETIDQIAQRADWSHLAVSAPKESWFRDGELIRHLDALKADGLFSRFGAVTFIGASHAGGGFAALAFAPLCPGATVVSFSPQSTLVREEMPWDTRFGQGGDLDRTLPYTDAKAGVQAAGRVYIIYDSFQEPDALHVARLLGPQVVTLRGFGLGQEPADALRRMDHFDGLIESAADGTLSASAFYRDLRDRKNLYKYRINIEAHLKARGKDSLSERFADAFRERQRQKRIVAPQESPTPICLNGT